LLKIKESGWVRGLPYLFLEFVFLFFISLISSIEAYKNEKRAHKIQEHIQIQGLHLAKYSYKNSKSMVFEENIVAEVKRLFNQELQLLYVEPNATEYDLIGMV